MKPFSFTRATTPLLAVQAASQEKTASFIAGGTNLVDLMKEGVENPDRLIDINRLDLNQITASANGLRLGAVARNAPTANHPIVRRDYPLLTQAILAGASAQLRNVATNGGNLLQRTRCYYFYDTAMPCNKRQPGSGCSAIGGFNRVHAVLGTSTSCIATHPSDMCIALAALDATVQVQGTGGRRSISFADLHRLPGNTPHMDTNLPSGDLITAIDLPIASAVFAPHSHYLKVRDRASYAFALVSVAAALNLSGSTIRQARIALGGVAHKPWRSPEAEQILTNAPATEQTYRRAAEAAMQSAQGFEHNTFKIELAKRAIVRALTVAAQGT